MLGSFTIVNLTSKNKLGQLSLFIVLIFSLSFLVSLFHFYLLSFLFYLPLLFSRCLCSFFAILPFGFSDCGNIRARKFYKPGNQTGPSKNNAFPWRSETARARWPKIDHACQCSETDDFALILKPRAPIKFGSGFYFKKGRKENTQRREKKIIVMGANVRSRGKIDEDGENI